jgi:hypothetical protein
LHSDRRYPLRWPSAQQDGCCCVSKICSDLHGLLMRHTEAGANGDGASFAMNAAGTAPGGEQGTLRR